MHIGARQPVVMASEPRIDGGQPKNFLRPCLLLLLRESSDHGYELLERLRGFGFERDPGGLYRVLRSMEHEGLVRSEWEPSTMGPDRRRYELTPNGRVALGAWTAMLEETSRLLEAFMGRLAGLPGAAV